MFDIGFWEIMFIGLIALVVVGPERLPKLAYTAGKWLGKGRSMLSAVKGEIDKEMKAEELKEILAKQQKSLNPLHEIIEETSGTVNDFKNQTYKTANEAEKEYSADPASQDEAITRQASDDPGKA